MDIKCRDGGIWPLSYWLMCGSLLLSYSCSSAEESPLISYSPWTGLHSWHPASCVTTTLFWSQLIHKITRGSEDDRCDPNPAVVSEIFPLTPLPLRSEALYWMSCFTQDAENHPQILKYGPSWKLTSAGLSHLPWNAPDHKSTHDKGGARTGQLCMAKSWNQLLLSKIKVIFNLTFDGSTAELCLPKLMESFLDHEVTTSFMLLFQSSLRICNLQANQSQDLLCMMEWNCSLDCELCGQEALQSIQVLQGLHWRTCKVSGQ